jgi:inositol oxygenase
MGRVMTVSEAAVLLGEEDPIIKPGSDAAKDLKAELKLPAQEGFRNYENSAFQDRVERTYYNIQTLHTVDGVKSKLEDYRKLEKAMMSVSDMMKFLDTIVDESDPDNDLPQSYHAYQTAESVFRRYIEDRETCQLKTSIPLASFFSEKEWASLPGHVQKLYGGKTLATHFPHIADWSWLPLVGLIHDLGKVCMEESFGGMPQWSGVGDTFVLGCDFDPANIFSDRNFYHENPDYKCEAFRGQCGMYQPKCGFNKALLSFGHDEYLGIVLEGHAEDVKRLKEKGEEVPEKELPEEAIYMVRFHSFYPWHTPRGASRGYTHLATEEDWRLLPLLKALQKSDLYSKTAELPPMEELQSFYGRLIREYFLPILRW